MTDDELAAIRARVEEATPGPWKWYHPAEFPTDIRLGWGGRPPKGGYLFRLTCSHDPELSGGAGGAHAPPSEADAAFIAAARTDVPALLAEVERLRTLAQGLAARVAAQSELLSHRAEGKPT